MRQNFFFTFFVFVGLNKNNLVIGLLCLIARGHNGAKIFFNYFLKFYSQKNSSLENISWNRRGKQYSKMTSKRLWPHCDAYHHKNHSMYIRTVSSWLMLSAMHNWFKQFMGSLGRARCTVQLGMIQMYHGWRVSSLELTVLIYIYTVTKTLLGFIDTTRNNA